MPILKNRNKNQKSHNKSHEPDKPLIVFIFIAVFFGLIVLASASSIMSYEKFGDAYYYFKHQLLGLGLGLAAFWFFAKTDYHVWKKYAFGFLIVSILLLIVVFIPGISADYGKARSWINIFGFSLQPSEFVKLSFLLYLAAWLEVRKEKLHDVNVGIGPFVIVLGLIAFLMLLQPDIGTLSIISITSLIVYFVGGGKFSHVIGIILVGILAVFILVQVKPYQANRFKCFFDPSYSKQDICYQVNQSLIAVGSGGFMGRGLGESRQKYMYLPEASGDSIFAIMAEEIGFVFVSIFVLCYLFIFYRGFMIAKYAPDDFGKILSIGIVSWIIIQALINIGGTVNIMPMTGVPLPLVSYGGTAILASLAAFGILVNISKQTRLR